MKIDIIKIMGNEENNEDRLGTPPRNIFCLGLLKLTMYHRATCGPHLKEIKEGSINTRQRLSVISLEK